MAILDQFGRPIKPADVAEPQTAKVSYIHQEWARHPARGLTPARLATILEEAEMGHLIAQADLAEDMEERDAHLHSELSKRRRALLTVERQIDPPRNASAAEKKATEFAAEMIEDLDFDELILNLGDAILKSYAPVEIDWKKVGKDRIPDFDIRPQRWFQLPPNQPYSNEIRLRNNTAEGEALIPGGWLLHTHRAKPGYIARSALSRILCWPYLFKNYSTRDFAEFLEIYGLPIVTGKYPRGASRQEKTTLLTAVANIGHAARGIMPDSMQLEIQDAASGSAAGDPFMKMMDWAERSESKAILGQVLSAEAKATGMGSGVANLQDEVRDDILRSDARQISRALSEACYLIAVFNGHSIAPGRGPRYKLLVDDSDDLKSFADSVPKLVDVGVQIPEQWVHDRLKIPKPEKNEPVLQTQKEIRITDRIDQKTGGAPAISPKSEAAPDPKSALSSQERGGPANGPTPASDRIASGLENAAGEAMGEWITQIQHLVDTAESLDQLRDQLLAAFSDLPADKMARLMQAGIAIAELSGRYDISETHGLRGS